MSFFALITACLSMGCGSMFYAKTPILYETEDGQVVESQQKATCALVFWFGDATTACNGKGGKLSAEAANLLQGTADAASSLFSGPRQPAPTIVVQPAVEVETTP